jgi:hypothetical protein
LAETRFGSIYRCVCTTHEEEEDTYRIHTWVVRDTFWKHIQATICKKKNKASIIVATYGQCTRAVTFENVTISKNASKKTSI